jgi:hypothetical protein
MQMNCKKISVLAFALVGALLLASAANAAPPKVFLGVGSSAQFPTAGIAAVSPDPVTATAAPCGSNLWTGKNGSAGAVVLGIDPRQVAGVPPSEPGNIWVAWDVEPNPTVVCAYLVVDSIVGVRLYSAQGANGDWTGTAFTGNGTLHFTPSAATCGNLIAGFPDNAVGCTVPADVVAAINSNGSANPIGFNVAMTDVRPEDAQFANGRVSVTFGYGGAGACGPNPFLSSFSATNAQVCKFNISGSDPVSGLAIPAFGTYTFGAAPEVIFGNNNGTMGGAGCTYPTNILSKTVSKIWSGQIGTSQQFFGPGVCNARMAVMQREAPSGTYTVFDFQMVHARDGNSGDFQEENGANNVAIVGNPPSGNCPTPPAAFTAPYTCTNPLVLDSGQNSIRFRVVGTGEMVKAVNGTTANLPPAGWNDRIGYAFYSLGTFFSAADANVRYFTLQGVDGLYGNYDTAGAFGTCTGNIPANTFQCTTKLPSFAHLIDGSYRVWSNYRWMAPPNLPATDIRIQVLNAGQDQAHFALANPGVNGGGITCSSCNIKAIADFVPAVDFPLFRSHYPLGSAGVTPADANNGTTSPVTGFCAADQVSPNCFEEGGDVAGVVFFKVTDVQLFNATGNELLTNIE